MKLFCRRCGHSDDAPDEAANSVAICGVCGARVAFGVTMPRVIIEPTEDPRFLALSFDGVRVLLDRPYCAAIARELASVCRPEDMPTPTPPPLATLA